jgi:restriction endonuclease S subunit
MAAGSYFRIHGIKVDKDNNINLQGIFNGPWLNIAGKTVNGNGGTNIFLAQVNDTASSTGIGLHRQANPAVIYPNPSNGEVTINYDLPPGNSGNLSITDITGRNVFELTLDEGSNQAYIYTGLPEGMFIYTLTVNNETVSTGKLMIAR